MNNVQSTKPILLLIDTESGMHALMQDICTTNNYDLLFAQRSKDALKIVRKQVPDLIILDLAVNGEVSGLQLIGRFRRNRSLLGVPIMILTNKDSLNDRAAAMEQGATDYISKPFDFDVLAMRIRTLIDLKKTKKHFSR